MPLNWRIPLLLSIALPLAASDIFLPTAGAQTNGFVSKEDAALGSSSQAPSDLHWVTFLSWYDTSGINRPPGGQVNLGGSLNLDVPRFEQNNSGFENAFYQLVNLGEPVDQTDDSSTQVLAPLPMTNVPLQVSSELLAESDATGARDAAPPLPNPPEPSDQGWHFSISPYLWLPAVHGTIGALGQEASVHASFSDIFSHFSFALMGAFDPRYNRIVMPLDFMWIRLTSDKASPFNVLATSAKIKVNLDVLTQKIGYRVVDAGKFKVDALAGVRYWHAGTTLDLESSVLTKTNFYGSADWVDAVGGARIQVMLSPKLVLTIAGDAGGGGANSDYQIAGLIGWKLKKIILQAGYRYLTVNYRHGSTICDLTISGLILGATIPLK
jgi:hypothetical protein